MSGPTPGAYEAAIDYLGRHIDIDPDSDRWLLDDKDVRGLAAAIGAAGVAAGRAQAAADIRASIPEVADYVWDASAPVQREIAAQIAEGGDPR